MSQNLPTTNLDVGSFCRLAKQLAADEDTHNEFVRFTLLGERNGRHVVVDPILNRMSNNELFSVRRDYDSVLGIHKEVLVNNYLTVSLVGKSCDTLYANVHLKYRFVNSEGPFLADIHKVPNISLGTWGTRNVLRAFLPELYSETRTTPFLTDAERKIFYEKGLLPAMKELNEESATEWPSRYDDELFRARGRKGQFNLQSKVVPQYLIPEIGECLRSSFAQNDCLWGTGLVFLHQLRGLKESHRHNDDWAEEALEDFFQQNNIKLDDAKELGEWWVDTAIEVCSESFPPRSLAWRTDSHFSLIRDVINIADNHADRITRLSSSKYTRDLVAHLPAVSGCRISPGPQAQGPKKVQYLQLYTTDKALTYRPGDGAFSKRLTVPEVMEGKHEAYIESLYELYRNAIHHSYSKARLEMRVPLRHASTVLLNLDRHLLRESLVSFPPSVLWSLRSYRALAIKFVLDWQAEAEWKLRSKKPALLLTVGCVWLLNGLHSTYDKGSSSKELMAAILPHTRAMGADPDTLAYGVPTSDDEFDSENSSEEDEDIAATAPRRDATTLPCFNRGLVFLREIRIGDKYPAPRFDNNGNNGQFLSDSAFKFFFKTTLEEVRQDLFNAGQKKTAGGSRVRNRARRTATWVNWGQAPEGNLFKLSARGLRLPTPPHDGGSDISENSDVSDDDAEESIDAMMTNIWRQFLLDITSKAPNMRNASAPSYCKLDAEERSLVTDETYKNDVLSDYFNACSFKSASVQEWKRLFDRFFPSKELQVAIKIQNYSSTKWWNKWLKFRSTADAQTVEGCKKALYKRFKKLYWMPFAQSDRIWRTTSDHRFTKLSSFPSNDGAPLVLINSSKKPSW